MAFTRGSFGSINCRSRLCRIGKTLPLPGVETTKGWDNGRGSLFVGFRGSFAKVAVAKENSFLSN
jgi:hypothetical protein